MKGSDGRWRRMVAAPGIGTPEDQALTHGQVVYAPDTEDGQA